MHTITSFTVLSAVLSLCGVCSGLDIKTAAGMKLMKKDMGGAALVLALAHVIMSAQLPVKLRVLVPAVENAISGNAYRCAFVSAPTLDQDDEPLSCLVCQP